MGIITVIRLLLVAFSFSLIAQDYTYILPPKGWKAVDPEKLSPHVRAGFVSDQKKSSVPSLTIAEEHITLTEEEYVRKVIGLYQSKRENMVSDMGSIQLSSGSARFLQIEVHKTWGTMLILQAITVRENKAHILTAVSPKEDFPSVYQDIIKAFSSFSFASTPLKFIKDQKIRTQFKTKLSEVCSQTKDFRKKPNTPSENLLSDKQYQKEIWKPYQKFLRKHEDKLGIYFSSLMLTYTANKLRSSS